MHFTDMDSWKGSGGNKFGLTYEQIVLMHINRCVINGSVEWHGGYWQDRIQGTYVEKYYIQNSRDVYCNSIKMLRALLKGHFDEEMEKANEEIENNLDEIYKTYQDKIKDSNNKSLLNEAKQEWYSEKVSSYIKLFEELIKLVKRLNFFKEEGSEEEM